MADLTLATRGSPLALAQTKWVAGALTAAHPGLEVGILEVTTSGDVDRSSPIAALTETGAFVRGVQRAVLDGRADAAVHSAKDLPVEGPEGLVPVHPVREAPWDVLCGATLDDLPVGARVGTGSPRRAAQLWVLRPDLDVVPVRGNVGTRLGMVGRDVDAVVLAEAGLARLGRTDAIAERLGSESMVPAPAQAALCVEATTPDMIRLLEAIDHPATSRCVAIERRLLAVTGAGCRAALGALAVEAGGAVEMVAFVDDEGGPRRTVATDHDDARLVERVREGLGL